MKDIAKVIIFFCCGKKKKHYFCAVFGVTQISALQLWEDLV